VITTIDSFLQQSWMFDALRLKRESWQCYGVVRRRFVTK